MYTENLRNWVYLLGQTDAPWCLSRLRSQLRPGRSIAMFICNYGWQLPRGALIINDVDETTILFFFFFSICRTPTNLFLSNFIGKSLRST